VTENNNVVGKGNIARRITNGNWQQVRLAFNGHPSTAVTPEKLFSSPYNLSRKTRFFYFPN
jgi:hypothetical protein